ncbi:EamA family transporter [Candidatus Woesearchaeota archaeon]|nr:EamA family transporter [Candidatus Woesearchaeota archaeon]
MSNNRQAILLALLCTIFTSAGQLMWKMGVGKLSWLNWITFLNAPFLLGFVCYGLGAVLMLMAFKKGELSLVYPLIATSYVWVGLLSPYFFPTDSMNLWKFAGIGVILVSVGVLGWGSSKKTETAAGGVI